MSLRLVDIDQHYYEPDDCCTRHVEAVYADRVPQPRATREGGREWHVGGRPVAFERWVRDVTLAPGAMHAATVADGTRERGAISLVDTDVRAISAFSGYAGSVSIASSARTERAVERADCAATMPGPSRCARRRSGRPRTRRLPPWKLDATPGRRDAREPEVHGRVCVQRIRHARGTGDAQPVRPVPRPADREHRERLVVGGAAAARSRPRWRFVAGREDDAAWLGGRIDGPPSEILRRHLSVAPYLTPGYDAPIPELIDALGAEHVVFGSDWPHGEGRATPLDYADDFASLDDAARHRCWPRTRPRCSGSDLSAHARACSARRRAITRRQSVSSAPSKIESTRASTK